MSMRKSTFCICENKGPDQLCSNCTAEQHLCFRYTDSTIPLQVESKISRFLPASLTVTGQFVSDQAGNSNCWNFSCKGTSIFQRRPNSRVSSASVVSTAKLPSLSAEQRARLNKLMKPRPLSKEMLFTK